MFERGVFALRAAAADDEIHAVYPDGAGGDVEAVDLALAQSQACLLLVVLSEVLSDPELPRPLEEALLRIPTLDVQPGYWERAGRLRAQLLPPATRPGWRTRLRLVSGPARA